MSLVVGRIRKIRRIKNVKKRKIEIVEKSIKKLWNCAVISRIYYMKFTFKSPEYTRNVAFLWFSWRLSKT